MTRIVGIDLSLTSTGVAVITDRYIHTDRITSTGHKDDSLSERRQRLHDLALAIRNHVLTTDLVVIEQPAYSRKTGHMHDRSGLWWLVVDRLEHYATEIVEVPPTARSKYATGKGNAAKDHVLAAVIRRYPEVEVTGNDEADALVLAAMGARALGHPIEVSLPQTHLDAMAKVAWPTDTEGAA